MAETAAVETAPAEGVVFQWPKPHWVFRDDISPTMQSLCCTEQLDADLAGEPWVLVEVMVDTDELGRVLEGTWSLTFTAPDGGDEWYTHEQLWPDMGEQWQEFADRTWLKARRKLIESRVKFLEIRSQAQGLFRRRLRRRGVPSDAVDELVGEAFDEAPDETTAKLRQLRVLQYAYAQPKKHRAASVRLAASWTGTLEELKATLPSLVT